ncbi:hypothetical protein MAC_00489 [Metarhizium acridum CQMa 102]|uniref:Uncharacterized protein n=1 Tax=Metarhizium acridum (strain CQMa 102) TaxID=655827 RepID=E9DS91_METAQ|nr:uncharacterized protein MAC_00489 [Metarhizium acridum CQMa 102]EFY93251.1 hypothetical protein MAC_00489 [Metarhizium acridum CQMa 102]
MHSSVCLVLLTCLYGTSFAAPINAGSLTDGVEHLPSTNPALPIVVDPEQGGLPDGVKRAATRSLFDGVAEGVTKGLPIPGGVGGLADAGSLTKAVPGFGKRDATDDVTGSVTSLTKGLTGAVEGTDIAGVAGQRRDGTVGSHNDITDNVPIIGQNLDPTDIAESLGHLGDVTGVGADSVVGKQKRDTTSGLTGALPVGSAGGIAKPVTDIVGALNGLDGIAR